MKILSFFPIFWGHFFPPGSGSGICMRIRIQQLKLMRIHADPDPKPWRKALITVWACWVVTKSGLAKQILNCPLRYRTPKERWQGKFTAHATRSWAARNPNHCTQSGTLRYPAPPSRFCMYISWHTHQPTAVGVGTTDQVQNWKGMLKETSFGHIQAKNPESNSYLYEIEILLVQGGRERCNNAAPT